MEQINTLKKGKKDMSVRYAANFAHCVAKTGRWRGKDADKYIKYKKSPQYHPDFYIIQVGHKKREIITSEAYNRNLKAGIKMVVVGGGGKRK